MRDLTDEERDVAMDARRDEAVFDQLRFVVGNLDGDTDADMKGQVYMQLHVIIDGEREGQISGWYTPGHAARLKERLGVEST